MSNSRELTHWRYAHLTRSEVAESVRSNISRCAYSISYFVALAIGALAYYRFGKTLRSEDRHFKKDCKLGLGGRAVIYWWGSLQFWSWVRARG